MAHFVSHTLDVLRRVLWKLGASTRPLLKKLDILRRNNHRNVAVADCRIAISLDAPILEHNLDLVTTRSFAGD